MTEREKLEFDLRVAKEAGVSTGKVKIDRSYDRLEELANDLENLAALVHVCGAGFNDSNAFAYSSELDVCNAFNSINKQITEAEEELRDILMDLIQVKKEVRA